MDLELVTGREMAAEEEEGGSVRWKSARVGVALDRAVTRLTALEHAIIVCAWGGKKIVAAFATRIAAWRP